MLLAQTDKGNAVANGSLAEAQGSAQRLSVFDNVL